MEKFDASNESKEDGTKMESEPIRVMDIHELQEDDKVRYSDDGGKTYTYGICDPLHKNFNGEDLVFVRIVFEGPGHGLNVGQRTIKERIFERVTDAEFLEEQKRQKLK